MAVAETPVGEVNVRATRTADATNAVILVSSRVFPGIGEKTRETRNRGARLTNASRLDDTKDNDFLRFHVKSLWRDSLHPKSDREIRDLRVKDFIFFSDEHEECLRCVVSSIKFNQSRG